MPYTGPLRLKGLFGCVIIELREDFTDFEKFLSSQGPVGVDEASGGVKMATDPECSQGSPAKATSAPLQLDAVHQAAFLLLLRPAGL